MATHRWTHGTDLVRHDTNERITDGEKFEPRSHELRSFGDRIEELSDSSEDTDADEPASADESGGSDAENGDAEPPFDPSEFTVDELDARLSDSDHTNDKLAALYDAEENGEGRSGALDAIEDHKD